MNQPGNTPAIQQDSLPQAGLQTRIGTIEEAEARGEIGAVYQYCRDTLGRNEVPGLLKCFSSNPSAARLMVDMGYAILFQDGYLTRRQKEMVATYISGLNACPYCMDSHGHSFTLQGATFDTAKAIAVGRIDDAGLSLEERELLRFTGKVNSESFKIVDEDIETLRNLEWTEEQIAEAVHVAAMMGLCNRVANTFGLASQKRLQCKLD